MSERERLIERLHIESDFHGRPAELMKLCAEAADAHAAIRDAAHRQQKGSEDPAFDGLKSGLKRAREVLELAADTEMSGAIGCDHAYGRALNRAASIIDSELDRILRAGAQP